MTHLDPSTLLLRDISVAATLASQLLTKLEECDRHTNPTDETGIALAALSGRVEYVLEELRRLERKQEAALQPQREAELRGRTDAANRAYWEQRTEEQAP